MDLEKTINKARTGLKKVQRSSDRTKKRYLAVLSTLAMIVIVGLWFFYLNLTLPQPGIEETKDVVEEAVVEGMNEDSFFRTIGRGAENIFEDLKGQFLKFKEGLSEVREYSFEGSKSDFSPGNETPTPLP